MMIIRLFCPVCAYKAANKMQSDNLSYVSVDVPMPITELADDGKYLVKCNVGHQSTVFLDNIKFELLFEMGVNALLDGYPREAVSSFVSSLERFYEFYWHVTMEYFRVPPAEVAATWKMTSRQSERQLGMFVTACLSLTKTAPTLLSPNNEVKFRNDVIHNGYVPSKPEATSFGNMVMQLITKNLTALQQIAPEAVTKTYKKFSPAPEMKIREDSAPWSENEEHQGTVNHICTINVRNPITRSDDPGIGGVEEQFKRILRDRETHRMEMFTNEAELAKRFSKPIASPLKGTTQLPKQSATDVQGSDMLQGSYAIPFMGEHCAVVWPPEGWVIDSNPNGPYLASMYPSGLTQEEAFQARIFMYIKFSAKSEKLPDLDSLIKMQDQETRNRYRAPRFEYPTCIERPDCKTRLRIIEAEEYEGTIDCTLFMDFPDVVIFITLLSPKKDFTENLKKLEWVSQKIVKGKVKLVPTKNPSV